MNITRTFFNTTLNSLWVLSCLKDALLYKKSTNNVLKTQTSVLMEYLEKNKDTMFGNEYEFGSIRNIDMFRLKVPLSDYECYSDYINKIKEGVNNVLTADRVKLLEPTSGSTRASKYIPYTDSLKKEFQKSISAWIFNLYVKRPKLLFGQSYWSITPAAQSDIKSESGMKIGFEYDTEYLGFMSKHLLKHVLAVPNEVSRINNIQAFKYVTLLFLLRSRDLSCISIWSPTFLTHLLKAIPEWSEELIGDIKNGSLTPPGNIDASLREVLLHNLKPDIRRADELAEILSDVKNNEHWNYYQKIWPKLVIISCWSDGSSSAYVEELIHFFPDVEIQGKGLVATEGIVSFPQIPHKAYALAVRSHFFEFIELNNCVTGTCTLNKTRTYLASQLDIGKCYSVVITTGGGLYRYKLNDIIRVEGFKDGCPLISFVGKDDNVSDIHGEKINEQHIISFLPDLVSKYLDHTSFYMIAPEFDKKYKTSYYCLFIELERGVNIRKKELLDLSADIEKKLNRNYHYRYCRKLKQLTALRVFLINNNDKVKATEKYIIRYSNAGKKIGDIKHRILNKDGGWSDYFEGKYIIK